ncbi:MAG: hypothetical protein VCE43_11090 [Myxococcota bacterium]
MSGWIHIRGLHLEHRALEIPRDAVDDRDGAADVVGVVAGPRGSAGQVGVEVQRDEHDDADQSDDGENFDQRESLQARA